MKPDPERSRAANGPDAAAPERGDGPEIDDGHDAGIDRRAARAQRRREQRRDAIVEAAKRVFRKKGYHQASVADIIYEAGIARGTFYLYFEGKQDVFQDLVDQFLARIRGRIRPISLEPDAPAPLDQLRANFRRVFETLVADDDLATLMLRDRSSFDEESRAQVDLFFEPVLQMVKAALRVGQSQGIIRGCDVEIVAVTALGAVRQLLSQVVEAHRESPAGQSPAGFTDPEHVADELMSFILRGVFREPGSPD